ncbi:MAG: hypothetical protein PHX26_04730 [Proteiniphilum sp.]|nr:hypothetical protein [Proteiniphilum sp.]
MGRNSRQKNNIISIPSKQLILWRIAVYIRLSREDGNEESESVINQKKILKEFLEEYFDGEYTVVDFYIDAAAIIGLNQKPEANGRRFSPFSLVSAHFKANGGCNCLI